MSAQYPSAAAASGARLQHGGIGARAGGGLGHGEAGPSLAAHQRRQEAFLLGRAGQPQQRQHIGLVGRGAVQRGRPQEAAPGLFQHLSQRAPAQAQPAPFPGQLRRVQTGFAGLRAQLGHATVQRGHVARNGGRFGGYRDVVHEAAHAFAEILHGRVVIAFLPGLRHGYSSIFTPACFTTARQRSVSSAMCRPKASGVPPVGCIPRPVK
ncbi:hypothetical protein FQZ97_453260 [compost metagenome]